MGLADAYKRWRHGRGFGVHSPLAYDLVMNTLREHGAYYAYERLDAAARRSVTISPRRLRLVFRLLVRFSPLRVAIVGDDTGGLLRLAVKSANSRCTVRQSTEECDFVIVNNANCQLPSVSGNYTYVILSDRERVPAAADEAWLHVSHGLRLDNHHGMSIIVVNPGLPKQQIEVRY